MSFQEACESSDYLLGLSRYGEQLEWVYKFYSRERVKILLYDDLIANPQGFLSDLYSYLDVDPDFRPASITKIYNRIVLPETQKRIGRLGLGWLVQRVKNTAVGSMLKNCLNYTRRHHNDDYVRQLRAYFHNDVRQLETMIGRDLSSWICP
jgi:hypothetical protein